MAATAHVLHGSHRDMRWLLGPVMRDALRVWCPILKCKKIMQKCKIRNKERLYHAPEAEPPYSSRYIHVTVVAISMTLLRYTSGLVARIQLYGHPPGCVSVPAVAG